jgi:hypothetical protein
MYSTACLARAEAQSPAARSERRLESLLAPPSSLARSTGGRVTSPAVTRRHGGECATAAQGSYNKCTQRPSSRGSWPRRARSLWTLLRACHASSAPSPSRDHQSSLRASALLPRDQKPSCGIPGGSMFSLSNSSRLSAHSSPSHTSLSGSCFDSFTSLRCEKEGRQERKRGQGVRSAGCDVLHKDWQGPRECGAPLSPPPAHGQSRKLAARLQRVVVASIRGSD